jgi:pimeloyl-[acyl-carrier protein] synthase
MAGPAHLTASYGLLTDTFHADPAPVFARMRAEHPVHWDPGLGTWVITRYDDVTRVIRDPALSVDRGGSISRAASAESAAELAWCSTFVLRWMVFSDPPRHTRLRDAVRRAFTGQMVERLRPAAEAATAAALARAAPDGRLEVLADLAVPVPALVTAELLGLPAGDLELLKRWTADTFGLLGAGVASAAVVRAAHRSLRECRDYFAEVIESRRRRPGGLDLISEVVRADAAAELDDEELIGLCFTLVAGAYETTTHVVGNGLWCLLQHPRELARLREGRASITRAVEELFRFDGPALSVMRRTVAALPVGDAEIPAGDNVYCMLYAANRDPDRFPDPDRLDLERSDVRHLGLGHGIHFCLGAALSRMEAAVMLAALVRLPALQLDREALGGGEPRYLANLAIRGLAALPVRFTPGAAVTTR